MDINFHPGVNEDALADLAHSAYEEALSSGLNVDSFLRHFRTIAKRATQQLPLPEPDVHAALAHAERMEPVALAQLQADFESWANADILWVVSSKLKNGSDYRDQATSCAWAGYIAHAMKEQARLASLQSEASIPESGEGVDPADAQYLYQAAINCPRDIHKKTVVLHFSHNQVGTNALNQLGNRLFMYAKIRYGKSDDDRLYQAAIDCQHEIDDSKIVMHFDPQKPGHNALDQLSNRLMDCASKIFV